MCLLGDYSVYGLSILVKAIWVGNYLEIPKQGKQKDDLQSNSIHHRQLHFVSILPHKPGMNRARTTSNIKQQKPNTAVRSKTHRSNPNQRNTPPQSSHPPPPSPSPPTGQPSNIFRCLSDTLNLSSNASLTILRVQYLKIPL